MTARSAAEERKAAAVQRAAGAEQQGYFRSRPVAGIVVNNPAGAARSLAFPAHLRATKKERNGQLLYNLRGIASVTDTPYEMFDLFGPYDEIVDHRAFDATLANDPDVAFLVNHRGVTMARTTNGTLDLKMVEEGLQTDAWLNPKRQDVSDLVVAIDDRDIDQMSFAFMLEEGWWSEDFSTFKITQLSIDRGDVSAVNYGANPYTSIAARSKEILDDLEYLPAGAKRAALARLAGPEGQAPVRAPEPDPEAREPDPAGIDLASVNAWLLQHA